MVNCPNGFLCFNTQVLIIYIILISLLIYYLFNQNTKKNQDITFDNSNTKILQLEKKIKQQNHKINKLYPSNKQINNNVADINYNNNNVADINYNNNNINNTQLNYPINSLSNIPINVSTRPVDQYYTQIGVLYSLSNRITRPHILPLYGKSIYRGSHKWSYYTKTDDYHTIKIPIFSNGNKCSGEYGCDNLNNGDLVNVSAYPYKFKVELYDLQYPQYIPYI